MCSASRKDGRLPGQIRSKGPIRRKLAGGRIGEFGGEGDLGLSSAATADECACPWPSLSTACMLYAAQGFGGLGFLTIGYPNPNLPTRAIHGVDNSYSGSSSGWRTVRTNRHRRWSIVSVTIRIVPYVALRWETSSADLGNQATIPVTSSLQSTVTKTGQISSLLNPKRLGSIGRRRHAASQLL